MPVTFMQNLRRGHYELAIHIDPSHQPAAAFAESALAIGSKAPTTVEPDLLG